MNGAVLFGPRDRERLGADWTVGLICAVIAAAANAGGIVLGRQAFQHTDIAPGTVLRLVPAILVLMIVTARQGDRGRWGLLIDPPRRIRYRKRRP